MLKSICEIIVYLDSFKNIDLTDQGLYQLRITIQKQKPFLQRADPYHNIQIPKELRCVKKNKIRAENQIDDSRYKSKTFLIRYNDEQIDLEEAVIFRLELDTLPDLDTQSIVLKVHLQFAHNYTGAEEDIEGNEPVAVTQIKLNNLDKGIANYTSVGFGDNYKASLNLAVFSIMMDCKFRMYKAPNSRQKTPEETVREKLENIQQYFKWLNKTNPRVTPAFFYNNYVKRLRYSAYTARSEWIKALQNPPKNPRTLPDDIVNHLSGIESEEGSYKPSKNLVEVSEQRYGQYIAHYQFPTPFSSRRLQQEIHDICGENYTFFQTFIKELQNDKLNKNYLISKFHELMKERCGEFIFRNFVNEQELLREGTMGKEKRSLARKLRKKDHFSVMESYNLEDLNLFPKTSLQPILFHEITQLNLPNQQKHKIRLFVFSHGFQGSSYDMTNIKNNIKQFYPDSYFLAARSNEGMTDGDILKMGERLALQIKRFIRDEELESKDYNFSINMVGHSMGGLIIRAALKDLDEHKHRFGTFLTFSSPHLGYMNGTRATIGAGLWAIKKWNKTQSLEQLTMSDAKKPEDTVIYKLSQEGSLENFKQVILLSSYEDSYVPWHSARIHRHRQEKPSSLEEKMVRNIFRGKTIERVHRIDVSFEIIEKNIDSMIGRTAHIKFLLDESMLKMIMYCTQQLF